MRERLTNRKRMTACRRLTAAPSSVADLPAKEQAIAKKMMDKGYWYVVQIVTVDGDFGEPLYFKSPDKVGPFLRSFPDYQKAKVKWSINLGTTAASRRIRLTARRRTAGKFVLEEDRMGNLTITHTKERGSVFLQREDDKESVYDLLKPDEREDVEGGWEVEIRDSEPRAGALDELWEVAAKL